MLTYIASLLNRWEARPFDFHTGRLPKAVPSAAVFHKGGAPEAEGVLCFDFDVRLRHRIFDDQTASSACALMEAIGAYLTGCGYENADGWDMLSIHKTTDARQSAGKDEVTGEFIASFRLLYAPQDNTVLTLRRGSESMTVSRSSAFRLLQTVGFDAIRSRISSMTSAIGDGAIVKGIRDDSRMVTLRFYVSQDAREAAMAFFAEAEEGALCVCRNHVTAETRFVADSIHFTESIGTPFWMAEATLFCPDSFFTGTAVFSVPLPPDTDVTVQVSGQAETGFLLTLTASGEGTVNPSLIHADGSVFRITDTMEEGCVYTVSTMNTAKYVRKNGVDSGLFDRRSIFFPLHRGANSVRLTAESGADNLSAVLEWRPRYRML